MLLCDPVSPVLAVCPRFADTSHSVLNLTSFLLDSACFSGAFLTAQYHATPLSHTCKQVRLRTCVCLVADELQGNFVAPHLVLMLVRAALQVSSGEPRRGRDLCRNAP